MSSATTRGPEDQKHASPPRRDDYQPLDSIEQLGLVHDKNETLTPIDALFDPRQTSAPPRREFRDVL